MFTCPDEQNKKDTKSSTRENDTFQTSGTHAICWGECGWPLWEVWSAKWQACLTVCDSGRLLGHHSLFPFSLRKNSSGGKWHVEHSWGHSHSRDMLQNGPTVLAPHKYQSRLSFEEQSLLNTWLWQIGNYTKYRMGTKFCFKVCFWHLKDFIPNSQLYNYKIKIHISGKRS